MQTRNHVRVGVVGAGSMGRNHIRILSAEKALFHLVGFYDPDQARAAEVASQFSVDACHSLEALLEQVDAVVVAVPSSLHYGVALAAAARGVHALVEKPLALSLAQAQEITAVFAQAGCFLAVGHVERYNPVVTQLKKLLHRERVLAMEIRRYGPFDNRVSDADVVQDLMIHDIDLACNVLVHAPIDYLSAVGTRVKSGKLDFVQAQLQFGGGAIATLSASRITENKIREIAIHTDRSYILGDLLTRSLSVTRNTNLFIEEDEQSGYRQESVTQKIFVPMVEPLRAELVDFYHGVVGGQAAVASGQSACTAIAVAEEITAKAGAGCPA